MSFANRARIFVLLIAFAMGFVALPGTGGMSAQEASPTPEVLLEPPPPPVTSFLQAFSVVEDLPTGRATVSLTRVEIAPRVALRAIVTTGPVLILVDSGTLMFDADAISLEQPQAGLAALQPDGTPGPGAATGLAVTEGNLVTLPVGTRVQLRNATDSVVELRIIAIAPEGEEPIGQPAE